MLNEKAVSLGQKRSVIREIFEYANSRRAEIGAENVLDFSLGNPSIPSPDSVRKTLEKLIEKDAVLLHGYTSAQGDKTVREKICRYINDTFNYPACADLTYLTCGAAASLTATLGAILNEGDEVVVFAPYFPEYKVFIENAGGVVKPLLCNEPEFSLPLDKLKGAINNKTRAVILNSPNNPTGAMVSEKELRELSRILSSYNGIYLISDEPYRELCYDTKPPFVPNFYKNTVVCYSFSKSLSLPGERIGYVLVSNECEEKEKLYAGICGAARERGFVCAPSMFQYLIGECVGQTADISVYKQNRDILYTSLSKIGYTLTCPKGAFYLFMRSLESDANAFCERAKKYELMLVPSDDFGVTGWVRIAYCVSPETVKKSIEMFQKLFEEYKNDK